MSQITEAQRIARISELLADLNKVPPERNEVARLPWTAGEPLLCPVIKIPVDEVVLNPRSHRIRAQLEDDSEWQQLREDPLSEAAQRVVQRHVRAARTDDQFAALKESLLQDGQAQAGVITHTGLLINANTRAVALRELENPSLRYVRAAVLPQTAQPTELSLLELRLQMQEELKEKYSMTNELLFVEELHKTRGFSPAQIAIELRLFPESKKKGENEVMLRLRLLDLIRTLQCIPSERLSLRFFDERISYEQLRELHRTWFGLIETEPARARRHLESFLLSIAVGVTPVHQVRRIDADFMARYMIPHLDDEKVIGDSVTALTKTSAPTDSAPSGVSVLAPVTREPESQITEEPNLTTLLEVVTSKNSRFQVPGSGLVLERDDVVGALKSAVLNGITDKRRDDAAEDKLSAPIEAVKQATKQVDRARDAWQTISADGEFDDKRRKVLEGAYKKLRRSVRDLEAELSKAKVIPPK